MREDTGWACVQKWKRRMGKSGVDGDGVDNGRGGPRTGRPKGSRGKAGRGVKLSLYHQNCMRSYKRFMALMSRLNRKLAKPIPKWHMVIHMLQRAVYQGNPTFYMVFYDESLNKLLKKTLRTYDGIYVQPPPKNALLSGGINVSHSYGFHQECAPAQV